MVLCDKQSLQEKEFQDYQNFLENRITDLETKLRIEYHFEVIVGHHPKVVEILRVISKIADTDATVLIQGENGTGKELIAQTLHHNSSRNQKSFIPINCGALTENLLDSELFGHVQGAFTGAVRDKKGYFERANCGTIFLDEISEMSFPLQVKLLRILQTGEYSLVGSSEICHCDVRIIAATNKNLRKLVNAGLFREDLYYRLKVIDLELPPLRERKSDILLLTQHFIKLFSAKYGKGNLKLSRKVGALLLAHDFPGNIRELEHIVQHAIVLVDGNVIEVGHLPRNLLPVENFRSSEERFSTFKLAKRRIVEKFEQEYIIECLKASKGNISCAAKVAGIDVKNFHTKMTKYGIEPHSFKKPAY